MNDKPFFTPQCPSPERDEGLITLAHGGGGLLTRRLIDDVFRPAFAHNAEDLTHDGAVLEVGDTRLAFTTDSYVVKPLFFPGGDIGSMAVYGTVNDLAMCGAKPLYLSAGMVIEEGFALADLRRVVASMSRAAQVAGVRLVTGDTKVVERGKGDGIYITTSGVGQVRAPRPVAPAQIREGDAIILSGDIARHGMAVMAAREDFGFENDIASDCAPLAEPVLAMLDGEIDLHCLRDLTRGGLGTALVEIAVDGGCDLQVARSAIPVSDTVRGACEILGIDPIFVANEGRYIAIVPGGQAGSALAIMQRFEKHAAVIGEVGRPQQTGQASLTTMGGDYVLDLPTGEQLPRIC